VAVGAIGQEDEVDEVPFVDVEVKGVADEGRPQWCPHDQRPVRGENGQRDVSQSGDKSLHTRGNVGGHAAGGWREKAGDRVQVVSFELIELERAGQRFDHLR